MKFIAAILLFSCFAFGQNEQLAQYYFDKGDFGKALLSYEELVKAQPQNAIYFQKLIESHQQLSKFAEAKMLIEDRIQKYKQAHLLVELGYNYHLQKNEVQAKKYYEEALEKIKTSQNEVYTIASTFERRSLIEYALRAYQTAREIDSRYNFNYQMAVLYGQLGNHEMMINTFLDEAYANANSVIVIQSQLSRFMNEDAEEAFVSQLRKSLLLRAQKNQDVFWNQFLSWFYIQQKEYNKAFIQEKAVYMRNRENLLNIVNLAQLAMEEGEPAAARDILSFVLENTDDPELEIQSHFFLTKMKLDAITPDGSATFDAELTSVLDTFGRSAYTLQLQLMHAHFTAFHLMNPEKAKLMLEQALDLPLNKFQQSEIKMKLADILLFEQKFNQALLYYSQIEEDLKNDAIGHEASLKAARTSYFKEDFEWAQKQFKELKSASSQLIANDALEYFLLLTDNTAADSTQTALKKFAKADYLVYQNKPSEALARFLDILQQHKGEEIEAVTLLRIGTLYEKSGDVAKALETYQKLLAQHAESIYVDEALFFSANIQNRLGRPEEAKSLYEKLIFNHPDSIHFVEARKQFRTLRGDTNL